MSIRPQNRHLKPFKKGQSGNPRGKPKQLLTKADVETLFQKFAKKTKFELQEVIDDPKATMIEIMVASVMVRTVKDGDASRLQFLLDRAVGKVKDEIDLGMAPKITYRTIMAEDGRLLQERLDSSREEIEKAHEIIDTTATTKN
jgi:hypothetical protein